jgi:DNA-binding transcriptional MerR regulator
VSTGYRIKEIAERSGFSPATLRYYEEIGIMPQPERTSSGYRRYDQQVLDRLAFIARAKQLGCSLEEVGELTKAWDGGECGPVQDRLRSAVATKLASAQAQIGELLTLTADLQRAARNLERHRPEGPCDERCGCLADDDPSTKIELTAKPEPVAIACTLSAESLGGRLDDWQSVLSHAVGRDAIEGGVRVELDSHIDLTELCRLAAAEQDCCRFFAFSITIDGRGVGLEVRAPADAVSIVEALFGAGA